MKHKQRFNELEKDFPVSEAPYVELCEIGFFGYRRAKLIVVWGERSKMEQLLVLKKLYPKLNELTAMQILDVIRKNKNQWEFAEMGWGNAMDLVNKATAIGVNIILKEID